MDDRFCGLQISNLRQRLEAEDGSGAEEDQDAKYERLQAAAAEDAAAAHLAAQATVPEDLSTSAELPGWGDTPTVVVPHNDSTPGKGRQQRRKKGKTAEPEGGHAGKQHKLVGSAKSTDGVSEPAGAQGGVASSSNASAGEVFLCMGRLLFCIISSMQQANAFGLLVDIQQIEAKFRGLQRCFTLCSMSC